MKKILTTLLSLLCMQVFYAQGFVPVGTTWHYANDFMYPYWEKMVYTGNTGNCMKMEITRQQFTSPQPGQIVPEALQYETRYFCMSGDTMYSDNYILFIFNAPVGTSWTTAAPIMADSGCMVYNQSYIHDTGTVVINGQSLRYWDVRPVSGSIVAMSGRFVEHVGYLDGGFQLQYFMGPPCASIIIDGPMLRFSCFDSPDLGAFSTNIWPYSACEYYLQQEEEPGAADIEVFPNPAAEYLYVRAGQGQQALGLQILDMQGRLLRNINMLSYGEAVSLQELASGVYNLRIFCNGRLQHTQKIVKM